MSDNPFNTPGSSGSVNPQAAQGKLTPVGIGLIIVGVLSLLGGAYFGFSGGVVMAQGDQIIEQMSEADRQALEDAAEQGLDPQALIGGTGIAFLVWGLLNCVCSLVVIWGGICCLRLSGRMMAMIASILAIIPIFQMCCLGIPIGIWGIVVLMAPDVKAAFEANS